MTYKIAEKFKSIQGEGVYAGTPMAFIRFVGCSVGKKICQHCDTDFDKTYPWRGGGDFSARDLMDWARPYEHVCFTGGEPLNQDLTEFFDHELRVDSSGLTGYHPKMFHVETSGTVPLPNFGPIDAHEVWVCVSPKPGFSETAISQADEVKVIVPGLGEMTSAAVDTIIRKEKGEGYQCGPGEFEDWARKLRWPDISDALRWAEQGKTVFLQPRNGKFDVDKQNMLYVLDLLRDYPQLRLSVQMHKILKVQ